MSNADVPTTVAAEQCGGLRVQRERRIAETALGRFNLPVTFAYRGTRSGG